ncbi:hypothetical protein JYT24_00245 [Parvibaculum lavamentivorans]|nr:hypothetical protein [Parvibaculum lavamentivorans]
MNWFRAYMAGFGFSVLFIVPVGGAILKSAGFSAFRLDFYGGRSVDLEEGARDALLGKEDGSA